MGSRITKEKGDKRMELTWSELKSVVKAIERCRRFGRTKLNLKNETITLIHEDYDDKRR